MRKNMKPCIILLAASAIISSCVLFGGGIDSAATDASPLAPEIVAGTGVGRSRALLSSDEQNFGTFGMIQASAWNYNSMVEGTVPGALDNLVLALATETNIGNFVTKWQNDSNSHYENADASITSTITSSPNEIRQFDAFVVNEVAGYEYSRCIFFWPEDSTSYAGVDVTEVWEYANHKEVSVTMYNKDDNRCYKYLAITDTSSDLQKTSLLFYGSDYSGDISLSGYTHIGYIDFELTTAVEADLSDHSGEEDLFLSGYPEFSKLEALHAKSVTLTEAKAVNLDADTLEPFTGFDDRSGLF